LGVPLENFYLDLAILLKRVSDAKVFFGGLFFFPFFPFYEKAPFMKSLGNSY